MSPFQLEARHQNTVWFGLYATCHNSARTLCGDSEGDSQSEMRHVKNAAAGTGFTFYLKATISGFSGLGN